MKNAAAAMPLDSLPLAYLLQLMRDERQPLDVRIECAKAAAPYCHAKLSAVEMSGPSGGPIEYEVEMNFYDATKD
jgi:hypothetical protein